jgi:hypothetical protein
VTLLWSWMAQKIHCLAMNYEPQKQQIMVFEQHIHICNMIATPLISLTWFHKLYFQVMDLGGHVSQVLRNRLTPIIYATLKVQDDRRGDMAQKSPFWRSLEGRKEHNKAWESSRQKPR